MKRSLLTVVLLSLAANLGLVFALVYRHRDTGSEGQSLTSAASSPAGPTAASTTTTARSAVGVTAKMASEKIKLADAWRTLLGADLNTLAANLRAAGFAPKMVRAIVAAALDEKYAERRRQIMGDQPDVPYWKVGSMLSMFTGPKMTELRNLIREEQDVLKQVLGADAQSSASDLGRYYQRRMFGDLAPDKADMIVRIQQDYGELRAQIHADAGGVLLSWDREKLALLEKEQRNDIAALLSPEELRLYDLRSSPTARRLQSQLSYFNSTEQEYHTIYDLQSSFDERYNPGTLSGAMTPDQARQRQADQKQLQDEIKAALGDQRYADYQRSADYGFKVANRIATTLQLPEQNAVAVWALQQDIQQRASSIRADRSLPAEQRTAAMAALASEANQRLITLLTQQGADAYKQVSSSSWLRSLEMTTRRPSPPPASGTADSPQSNPATVTPPRG
jgi:hypothetical protein